MGKQESCLSNHTRFARIWKLFEKTQDLRGYEECLRKQKTCEDTIGNIKIVWQHTRLARIPAKNMKLVWQNKTLDEHFKTNISRRTLQDELFKTSLYWTNSHKTNISRRPFQDEHYRTNISRRAFQDEHLMVVMVMVVVVVVTFFRLRMIGHFFKRSKPGASRGHALKCHSCTLKHHAHAACS